MNFIRARIIDKAKVYIHYLFNISRYLFNQGKLVVEVYKPLNLNPATNTAVCTQDSTYLNDVWTFDMGQSSGAVCPNGSSVSYMLGYGGIGIVILPNGAVFNYVSDSDAYGFSGAEKELHKVCNICGN